MHAVLGQLCSGTVCQLVRVVVKSCSLCYDLMIGVRSVLGWYIVGGPRRCRLAPPTTLECAAHIGRI